MRQGCLPTTIPGHVFTIHIHALYVIVVVLLGDDDKGGSGGAIVQHNS